ANAALDDLGLDRRVPDAVVAAVGTGAVHEDARIASTIGPWGVRLLPPAILEHQVIVGVFLLGDQTAVAIATHVEQAILDTEDALRIAAPVVFDPDIKSVEILSIEEDNRLIGRAHRLIGSQNGRDEQRGEKKRQARHAKR